jgi:DNA invertase Pin-like site-specific DNA recombinase
VFGGSRVYTAAGYYRHSAEDKQENSVPIQREHAQKFASENGIQIIHEERDEGKSGLSAARPGFERLFQNWVLNPEALHLDYILVYDVTRWGRFQDPDEAAYWEMQCKKRGIRVVYVSRGFPKEEERLLSSLETSIGRYMAAEYSRQLSNKVFHGSIKVAEQGYSAGGKAPYGLTRMLLDEQHNVIGELKPGEHKVIANQRVTFAPANDESRQVVKRMFDELVGNSRHPKKIADSLNDEGILSPKGKQWDAQKIIHILSNEQYAGTLIYNKTWKRLKQPSRRNPTSEWVRYENAFEGIVTREQFEAAQERLYWLLPPRHRYGVYRLNAARRQFKQYLRQQVGQLHDDDKFKALRDFPITFGLTFYRNDQVKRCFIIDDKYRLYDEVLCVGVDMFAKNKVDAIYRLPAKLFGVGDYLVVRDDDVNFKQYIINTTDTDPIVDKMYRELIAS